MESIPSLREVTAINIFELVGKLSLTGASKVGGNLTELEKKTQKLQNRMKMLGAAFTAVGAAGLKMADSARKMNAQLGVTAINLDVTTKEMRNLALETTNVTFPLEEVIASFDLLARAGIKSLQLLKETATAFDTLGDAIGTTASIVTTKMIMVMKTYNLTAEEVAKKSDAITFLVRNTTISFDAFGAIIGYVTPELVAMGLTLDDTIALMAILEGRGVSGEIATRAFRTAITQATREQIPLNETLGVTNEEMEAYKIKLQEATGITEEYAAAANKQFGIMDKLKQKWSELVLVAGSFLQPLEPILAVMTAMGPMLLIFSTIVLPKFTFSTVRATLAQHGLNKAMLANPIWAIIAGITALVITIVYMWNNWEKVTLKMETTWVSMKDKVLKAGRDVVNIWGKMAEKLPFLEGILLRVSGAFSDLIRVNEQRADALALEKIWLDLAKTVKDNSEQMVTDVKTALDKINSDARNTASQAITEAERVRDEEKGILETRAQFYRDLTAERLGLIDEQMMAELAAMDPSGALAKLAEDWNKANTERAEDDAKRNREIEEDRVKALKKELRENEDLTEARKRELEDQIADAEARWETEADRKRLYEAIMETDSEGYFEKQKTLADQRAEGEMVAIDNVLQAQIAANDKALESFKDLNFDTLADLKVFVTEYNRILEGAGITAGEQYLVPEGPPPAPRTRPSSPAEVFNWMKDVAGWQHGGMITEPTLLYGLRSQRPYAIAGEAGPELVGPAISGGDTYNISFPGAMVREELDIAKIGQMVSQELSLLQNRKDRRVGVRSG